MNDGCLNRRGRGVVATACAAAVCATARVPWPASADSSAMKTLKNHLQQYICHRLITVIFVFESTMEIVVDLRQYIQSLVLEEWHCIE